MVLIFIHLPKKNKKKTKKKRRREGQQQDLVGNGEHVITQDRTCVVTCVPDHRSFYVGKSFEVSLCPSLFSNRRCRSLWYIYVWCDLNSSLWHSDQKGQYWTTGVSGVWLLGLLSIDWRECRLLWANYSGKTKDGKKKVKRGEKDSSKTCTWGACAGIEPAMRPQAWDEDILFMENCSIEVSLRLSLFSKDKRLSFTLYMCMW